jgi:hypothetical protein
MKKAGNMVIKNLWYLCLVGVIALGLMTIIGTGGGGGDDVSGGGDPTFLDVYDYSLVTKEAEGHFKVSFSDDSDTFTISVATLGGKELAGTFNTVTEAYTLDSGSGASINSDAGVNPLLGQFNINVTTSFQIPPDSSPTAGAFEVEYGADRTIVTVVTVPDNGVTLELVGGDPPEFFTWDQFEDLLDTAVLEWQQRASLSGSILEFMVQQLDFVVGSLGFIGDHEDELKQNITVTENCDAFPTGKAPAGVLEQGTRALTWDDASGNNDVGGGDNFTWDFDDCWDNDTTDDIDDLINGTVDLGSYTEVVDGNNRVTTIGFLGPEGVVFTNFVLSEVEEDPPGTFTIDPNDDITVNGGYTIVFYE